MAENDKQYFQWIDLPDGAGGNTRKYVKDAEAQEALAGVPSIYATKAELEAASTATMFRLYVDPEDMHLKGRNPADGTFEVVDGHLIMHQTT